MKIDESIDDARITLFGHLFEAHVRLTHLLDQDLVSTLGLPLSWYGVLLHVGRSPDGVRPMGELINATAFTSGGVTRLVDRMVGAGYVERRPCANDRRVQFVALTESGHAMLQRATEIHLRGIQRHMIAPLAPDEIEQLDATLAKLVAAETNNSPGS